jgi:hypothetical protein
MAVRRSPKPLVGVRFPQPEPNIMILVEICTITGPLMAMPYKANDRYKKFCDWARQYNITNYKRVDQTNRIIEFLDEKEYTIFVLTYPHEYKKL